MSADLHTQLRQLGTHLREQTLHVHTDEILERSAPGSGDDATGRTRRPSHFARPHRRATWSIAVAAALVLLLVGGLLVAGQRSGDTGVVDDGTTPLVLRDGVEQRWSAEVPTAGDELVPLLGPVAVGGDVVVFAVQSQVTALDLVDGRVRWQREYEDYGPFGAIVDLTSFGETVVFSVGARTEDDGSDPAVIALSMADGSELWRVSAGQAYGVLDGQVFEFEGLGGDTFSFRLIEPTDGSYLTETLNDARRDDVSTVGSLRIIDDDDGEPTLYDLDRRVSVPFAFASGVDLGGVSFALVGDDLVAVRGDEVVLYDDEGDEADRLRLPEMVHDAPWVTAFPHRELVVVSAGAGSVGIGVDDGRLAVRWESDAVVNSSAFDPARAIDASSPLAVTAGEGFSQPGGVIDLESGEVLPFDGELLWALVAHDGYAVLSDGLGAADAGTLHAYDRDGNPTWTLDVPVVAEGLEQWVLGDDLALLVSVARADGGISLDVAAYG